MDPTDWFTNILSRYTQPAVQAEPNTATNRDIERSYDLWVAQQRALAAQRQERMNDAMNAQQGYPINAIYNRQARDITNDEFANQNAVGSRTYWNEVPAVVDTLRAEINELKRRIEALETVQAPGQRFLQKQKPQ